MRTNLESVWEKGPACNAGLMIQRLYPDKQFQERRYPQERDKEKREELERDFLRKLAGLKAPEAYLPAYEEWRAATTGESWLPIEGVLKSRLTVGLGTPSAGENGIALSQTFGTPVIPGSSIKGALRAAALEMLGRKEGVDPRKTRKELDSCMAPVVAAFGAADEMGSISVMDAWWEPFSVGPFCLETWTPHHQGYMTKGVPELPLDTESPVPLSLIAVPAGARFRFAFLLPYPNWAEGILPVIRRALERGLGAKHNQGYGRFKLDRSKPEHRSTAPAAGDPESADDVTFPGLPNNGEIEVPGVVAGRGRNVADIRFGSDGTRPFLNAPADLIVGTKVWVKVRVQGGKIQSQITNPRNVRRRS